MNVNFIFNPAILHIYYLRAHFRQISSSKKVDFYVFTYTYRNFKHIAITVKLFISGYK
jgi:hypothetical protein